MHRVFHQTMAAMESSFTCRLLYSDLLPGEGFYPDNTDEVTILEYALKEGYSCIPLFDSNKDNLIPSITTLFIVDRVTKTKRERRKLQPEDLISSETPVADIFSLLAKREFYLILVRERVRGILARADINKLPVRAFLFTLLTHLEGLMAEVIEKCMQSEEWLPLLSDRRRNEVTGLYNMKKAADLDSRLIDCTTLTDKAQIMSKTPDHLGACVSDSKKKFDKEFEIIKSLRNRLGHNLPDLGDNIGQLRDDILHGQEVSNAARIASLAGAVGILQNWIEAFRECAEGKL